MADPRIAAAERFRASLHEDYFERFPRSAELGRRRRAALLDETSHAVRWNDPFMPTVARATGATIEDIDGHAAVDYWQGHFANLLGHNPPLIREALRETLRDGRGLQSGMIHEVELDVAEMLCRATGVETVRFTTSGTLGTFYATVLARAFTHRDKVLKVGGGWHGSQPYGLMGVVAHGTAFDRLESEGLSTSLPGEVLLTRFNDVEGLRRAFARYGDAIACFVLEPVLGAAGGIPASVDYLREARALTERHGSLLVCDEIITGFRFRAGDLSSRYGVRPDLVVLGKILGGGMPVAAVGGRRDVMALCSRAIGRVKFEGGTYSAHELSMVAARAMLHHLGDHAEAVYPAVAGVGRKLRSEIVRLARASGLALDVPTLPEAISGGSSLVVAHPLADGAPPATCPEELAARRHPAIDASLLKSVMLLEGVSTRNGIGAVSTAHGDAEVDRTLAGFEAALARMKAAGLL